MLRGPLHLPPLLPASPAAYAALQRTHAVLAYLMFFTSLGHLGAVLFHTLVIRDGLIGRTLLWNRSRR